MRLIVVTAILVFTFLPNVVTEERLAYLNYLLNQKQLLSSKISQMQSVNRNLIINLQLNSQANFQETWTASAIRDQHSLAIDALAYTFPSLSQKSSNCTSQDNQFGVKLTEIQSELDKARSTVDGQQDCLRNDFIKANFKFYQILYDGLREETINNCKETAISVSPTSSILFLDTATTKFVPSTDSPSPWIYGSITPEQYNSKKSQLMSLYGAVGCPSDTPFLDESNNCLACSNDQIYDISSKKCRICEAGTTYNYVLHECGKITVSFNSQLQNNLNFVGTPPPANSKAEYCPNDQPYFTGKSCISCSLPMYFSFQSNSCEACMNDSVFDSISKSCTSNSFFLSNLTDIDNFIGSPLSPLPYDSIKTCPSKTPFSNGKQCFSCSLPKFFNFQRMSCQACPSQYNFDPKTHSCASSGSATNMVNSNLIGNRNFVGKIPIYSNLFKNCDDITPFFNGKQCISCLLPSYFDFDTLTCSTCLNGLSFNIVIQTCEYINQDFFTDVNVKNIYYNGDFNSIKSQIDQRKSQNASMKVCPTDAPFYNSRTNACVGCTSPLPLFDLKNNKCMACPSGSDFDEESHLCLTKKVGATIERMIMNTA